MKQCTWRGVFWILRCFPPLLCWPSSSEHLLFPATAFFFFLLSQLSSLSVSSFLNLSSRALHLLVLWSSSTCFRLSWAELKQWSVLWRQSRKSWFIKQALWMKGYFKQLEFFWICVTFCKSFVLNGLTAKLFSRRPTHSVASLLDTLS